MMAQIEKLLCRKSSGFALLESLIAFIVLAVGLLALLSFHSESQKNISESKSQNEAIAIAEEKLNELESFLVSGDPRLTTNGNDLYTGKTDEFVREWTIIDSISTDVSSIKVANVKVTWDDRNGVDQEVILNSEIFYANPTSGLENFMEVVDVAHSVGAANKWNGGTGSGSGTGTGAGTGSGTGSGAGTGSGTGTGQQEIQYGYSHIAGDLVGSQAANFTNVSFEYSDIDLDGYSYAATCSITGGNKRFECTLTYPVGQGGWEGTITLHTNKVFCSVPIGAAGVSAVQITNSSKTVVLFYSFVSGDFDFDIVVANNPGQC